MEYIKEIFEKGKVPIIVGGTGLYVESLIYNIEYNEIKTDLKYREELEKISQEEGLEKLYEKALKIDEKATKKISNNDKKRIFRILEIYHTTGKTKTKLEEESRKNKPEYEFLLFGLTMDREKLYERINLRVDNMLQDGLVQEVKELLNKYEELPTAIQGLGYKEVVEYLKGDTSKEEMIEKIKLETRRYAKRQLTWFRKYNNLTWLNAQNDLQDNIRIILEEYSGKNN